MCCFRTEPGAIGNEETGDTCMYLKAEIKQIVLCWRHTRSLETQQVNYMMNKKADFL